LADSARRLIRRNLGDASVDQLRELAYYGAFVSVILGDRDEAFRLLREYIAANPNKARILRDEPGWWFRAIADTPEYRQIMGSAQ
jgi:hypothetical protein